LITVDLLRHGELEGGIKYRGQTDDPLTAKGRDDMDAVWSQVKHEVDLIISSPLSRCREPAEAWAEARGIEYIIDDRIAEMFYGDWEGMTPEEIHKQWPGVLEQYRRDPESVAVPGGESIHAFRDRIADFWSALLSQYGGKHLLVVAHSGSLRMLIAHTLDEPIAFTRTIEMPYACWSRVESIGDPGGKTAGLTFHNR